ncbi:MAG: hypothetical protein ACYCXA_13155 [Actinomycetes bacterium]
MARASRRARIVAAIVAVVLVAGGVTTYLLVGRRSAPPGLVSLVGGGITGAPTSVGQLAMFGSVAVVNVTHQPITLVSARLAPWGPVQPGQRLVRVAVASPSRGLRVEAGGQGYPGDPSLEGLVHALPGTVVPTQSQPDGRNGVEILFYLLASTPGTHNYAGAMITYREQGRVRHVLLQPAFTSCVLATPAQAATATCQSSPTLPPP